MKRIICFGDSNTHGYDGDSGLRFDETARWTKLLQNRLGNDYLVIEEGLSGRTTVFDDPLTEGLSGVNLITPIMMSHEPLDLLVIMLGTNDTKYRFGCSAGEISEGLLRLINKAKATTLAWANEPKILIVTPKAIDDEYENTPIVNHMGVGCALKSRLIGDFYKKVAEQTGCYYFDANTLNLENNKVDYMHLNKESHKILAEALESEIRKVLD